MNPIVRLLGAFALAAVLTGCAGTNFKRPDDGQFHLGKTTESQVVDVLGDPEKTGEMLKNDKTVRFNTYVFASTRGVPLEEGVIPARAQVFYFLDDVLVGQEFLSSFKDDHSNFDEGKVPGIKKGETTRSQVVLNMGRPTSTYIAPMTKSGHGEAYGYAYNTTRGGAFSGFKISSKSLLVTFDENDKVLDVDYSATGNK